MSTDDGDAVESPAAAAVAADDVPRLCPSEATEETLRRLLDENRPFILTGVAQGWLATREWVHPGEAEDFQSIDLLEAALGDARVPVVETGAEGAAAAVEYGEEPRREMTLAEYAALWRSGEARAQGLYLKDWHVVQALAQLSTDSGSSSDTSYYRVPPPLDDDWLNAWWDRPAQRARRRDDYRFLYLGPAGSRTPMHHDVLCSYSWSANLAGRKRWALFHPDDTPRLYHRSSAGGGSASKPTLVADADSPLLADVPRLEVTQEAGEVLFVPSGWHHQVTNATGCLSINHNWFNGSCLARVWAFLQAEAAAVREKLGDLRPTFDPNVPGECWERQCEVVLRANAALNLTDLNDMLVKQARDLRARLACKDGEAVARRDMDRILGVLRELRARYSDTLFPEALLALKRKGEAAVEVRRKEDEYAGVTMTREAMRAWVESWLDEEIGLLERDVGFQST